MKTIISFFRIVTACILTASCVVCILGIMAYYMEPLAVAFAIGASLSLVGALWCGLSAGNNAE